MVKISVKERLEAFFKMPFNKIINDLHIEQKISLNELSKRSGVSRQSLTSVAKKLNLKTRTVKEATQLTPNKGANHWAFGKTLEWHSEKMKADNPSFNNSNMCKRAKTISKTYFRKPLPQEIEFSNILKSLNVDFRFQYPIDRYVVDFFIPEKKLCIEIDSTSKWGRERREKAAIKDAFLKNLNLSVLRVNKKYLKDKLRIINILKTNNVIV